MKVNRENHIAKGQKLLPIICYMLKKPHKETLFNQFFYEKKNYGRFARKVRHPYLSSFARASDDEQQLQLGSK